MQFNPLLHCLKKSKSELILLLLLTLISSSCRDNNTSNQKIPDTFESSQLPSKIDSIISLPDGNFKANKTESALTIDGLGNETIWTNANWYDMNYIWMGEPVDSTDYHGKFKLAWDSQHLYILVDIIDDVLTPTLENGIENYWKGDYVEVFIDEDKSGGIHQYNHQAFAYHVSTEGHAIDKSTSEETIFLDRHVNVSRSQEGNKYVWEMAIKLFDNEFDESSADNKAIEITAQKRIGFSIAYGDNDGNNSRENFIGSKSTHGINNDEGYINSDVFGSIIFTE